MDKAEDKQQWKTLSSEYLIRRPWLTARRDEVQLPNGKINHEYYVLEYPDWVNVIAVTHDGCILIERQYRHALDEVGFEIVAGVIEKGETPLEAAKRELMEETGYSGGTWQQLMTISANPSTTTNLTHCFVATGVEPTGTQHLDETEYLQVTPVREDEVFGMLVDGAFRQSLMIAPLWKYFYLKSRSVGR